MCVRPDARATGPPRAADVSARPSLVCLLSPPHQRTLGPTCHPGLSASSTQRWVELCHRLGGAAKQEALSQELGMGDWMQETRPHGQRVYGEGKIHKHDIMEPTPGSGHGFCRDRVSGADAAAFSLDRVKGSGAPPPRGQGRGGGRPRPSRRAHLSLPSKQSEPPEEERRERKGLK